MLLICAATSAELAASLGKLAPADLDKADSLALPQIFKLKLKTGPALACLLGVGPLNAAFTMGLVLAKTQESNSPVKAVFNIGLAGAFDLETLPLKTHCAVIKEIWPEYGLHDGRRVVAAAFSFAQWDRPANLGGAVRDRLDLIDPEQMAEIIPHWHKQAFSKVPRVTSLTVAGVSASASRVRQLEDTYPGVAVENMEGFAVAYVCARYNIPCCQWRVISNKVGPRTAEEKDFDGAKKVLATVLPEFGLI